MENDYPTMESYEAWLNRVHTGSGLKSVVTSSQFEQIFCYLADAAMDRSIETLVRRRSSEQAERLFAIERTCRILEVICTDMEDLVEIADEDADTQQYVEMSNDLIVRGISIDFMYALFERSLFRSRIPFAGICGEIYRTLPVDEFWKSASTEEYQSLDQVGASTETFRVLFDAGLFRADLSFPALCALIEDTRTRIDTASTE